MLPRLELRFEDRASLERALAREWLHGGAFVAGAGGLPPFAPCELVIVRPDGASLTVGATVVIVASVLATIVWTVGPMREITSTAMVGAQDIDAGWLTSAVREVAGFLSIGFGEVVRAIVIVGLGVVLAVFADLLGFGGIVLQG